MISISRRSTVRKHQWTWINHVTQRFVERGEGLMFSFYQFACVIWKKLIENYLLKMWDTLSWSWFLLFISHFCNCCFDVPSSQILLVLKKKHYPPWVGLTHHLKVNMLQAISITLTFQAIFKTECLFSPTF